MSLVGKMGPVILTVVAALLGSYGQLALKIGMDRLSAKQVVLWKNGHLGTGIALYAVATVVFVYALRFGSLITLYPIIATSYIWTSLLARKYLGEPMNVYKWAGIASIILGIPFLVSR